MAYLNIYLIYTTKYTEKLNNTLIFTLPANLQLLKLSKYSNKKTKTRTRLRVVFAEKTFETTFEDRKRSRISNIFRYRIP